MTCIVALAYGDGKLVFGADSACMNGWYQSRTRSDPKLFKLNGDMIIGYTDSYRMGQLLRYRLQVPRYHESVDLFEYMATDFVDAVRKTFKDYGWQGKEEDTGRERGGEFLVGYHGRIFCVQGDFQVAEYEDRYASVGCGEWYALAALHTWKRVVETQNTEQQPLSDDLARVGVTIALETAQKFSAPIQAPYIYETLGVE